MEEAATSETPEVDVKKITEQVIKVAAKTIYDEIVKGNPVDTGFSASNWNISLGQPDYTVAGERHEGETYEAQPKEVPDNPELQDIFISNGVPYIGLLEEGHSSQAPSGFVAVAIERAEAKLAAGIAED
jgi:hypothetical protein